MTFWIIAGALWWIIGMVGFIYTWTTRYDLTTKDVGVTIMSGALGPLSWLCGWLTLIRKPWARTILHKRNTTDA